VEKNDFVEKEKDFVEKTNFFPRTAPPRMTRRFREVRVALCATVRSPDSEWWSEIIDLNLMHKSDRDSECRLLMCINYLSSMSAAGGIHPALIHVNTHYLHFGEHPWHSRCGCIKSISALNFWGKEPNPENAKKKTEKEKKEHIQKMKERVEDLDAQWKDKKHAAALFSENGEKKGYVPPHMRPGNQAVPVTVETDNVNYVRHTLGNIMYLLILIQHNLHITHPFQGVIYSSLPGCTIN
jgi:hypothetical protein